MVVRAVEGQKLWTGGTAITVDQLNKVISLNLRDENNLIIYDEGDDEIYVDLQLPDGIRPLDAFPVGVTTGRVLVADDWDVTGTIVCFKTTSGDNIKLLYGDDGKLYIDNGTGTFKQIYLKGEVDALLQALREYIDAQLALKQDKLTAGENITIDANNVISATPIILEIELLSADWNLNEQTLTATGVTQVNSVIISPKPSSYLDYTGAGIYCSSQGTDSLTFTCSNVPSVDILVNVLIWN